MNTGSEPLKVIHVVSSIAACMGGPSWVVKSLCENIAGLGHHVIVCTQDDEYVAGESVNIDRALVDIKRVPRTAFLADALGSTGFRRMLSKYEADLIHSHGLWTGANRACPAITRKNNTRHLITIHGMLEPWALSKSKWKKRIAGWLFQNRALHDAVCLHATALQEFNSFRRYGLKNPVAIVPNGIDTQDYVCSCDRTQVDERWPEVQGKHILLFLSRIHPKKGLLNLAEAWGRLWQTHRDWHLVIAGSDENGHENEVRMSIQRVGATNSVTFTGPVYGELKKHLYAACDLFVLPTFSENFGIVVAEALASGKPVITTKGTPWQELETHRCGWWIDIGVDPLEAVMKEAMVASNERRQEMGARGRRLVVQNYSWSKIATKMIDVYRWVLGHGPQPDCVRSD
jgi:glycosyltransferase involved in cell wall biosynthesis